MPSDFDSVLPLAPRQRRRRHHNDNDNELPSFQLDIKANSRFRIDGIRIRSVIVVIMTITIVSMGRTTFHPNDVRFRLTFQDTAEIELELDEEFNHENNSSMHRNLMMISPTFESLLSNHLPLPSHNLTHLLSQIPLYTNSFVLLVYDPPQDAFIALYSKKHHWAQSMEKLINAISSTTSLLRHITPNSFSKDGPEVAFAISGGDYPALRVTDCLSVAVGAKRATTDSCDQGFVPPVLHFGSTFRRFANNVIGMPMPEPHHLYCLDQYARSGEVCSQRKALVELGDGFDWSEEGWEDLIGQVVWRGTDFGYLQTLFPSLGQPSLASNIAPRLPEHSTLSLREQAILSLEHHKSQLVPRWKGVLLAARAESEMDALIRKRGRNDAERRRMKERMVPWANIKFSHYVAIGDKVATMGSREYAKWERMMFPAIGEILSLEELAKFRYHIDLGGGGGTTWSGTIQKLAMPGLLFHHVTPTKDYIHDLMTPWKHYIPIAPDLRDLRRKFDWAESNPERARTIAKRGTELARYLGSAKGMEEMLQKNFKDPIQAVMESYVPVSGGRKWRDVVMEEEGRGNVLPILKCTGREGETCQRMVGKNGFYNSATIRRMEQEENGER